MASPSKIDPASETAQVDVFKAARKGALDALKSACSSGVDLNALQDGMTPLMHAAYNQKKEAFKLLLSFGADPTIQGDQGEAALHLCAGNGWPELCQELIQLGCDVNARTATLSTPMHYWANRSSDAKTCEVLVRAGANLRAVDKDEQDPLGRATYWGRGTSTGLRGSSVSTAKLLIKMRVKPRHSWRGRIAPRCSSRGVAPARQRSHLHNTYARSSAII